MMPKETMMEFMNFLNRDRFIEDMLEEACKTMVEKGSFNSFHEAHSVLREEFEEFWDEVKKKEGQQDCKNMYYELIQIASICMIVCTYMLLKIAPDEIEGDAK